MDTIRKKKIIMQVIKSYALPDVLKVNIASSPLPSAEMAATYINKSGQKFTK